MIINHQELSRFRDEHASDRVAYCAGVFDLLHEGHLDILSKLHEFGNVAVVGVASDERVKFRKGPTRPIQGERTRLAVIDALHHVDFAFLYPNKVPGYRVIGHQVLETLAPNFFLTSEVVWEEDRELLAAQGTKLEIIPRYSEEISTTQIIERVLKANRKE